MIFRSAPLVSRAKILLLFISLAAICQTSFAQSNKAIDSLLNVLKTSVEDTSKVKVLNSLCRQFYLTAKYSEAKKYAEEALTLADKLRFKKGIAMSYQNIGNLYFYQANYGEALKNYRACLETREEIGDKSGMASSYYNIGLTYDKQGNLTEALNNHLVSLKIREEIGNKQGTADCYLNIGWVYFEQRNYADALKTFLVSLKINEEIGNKQGMATSYFHIGLIHTIQDHYSEALKNHLAALQIREETGDKRGVGFSYINIAVIYDKQCSYPEALQNYLASLKTWEEIGDKQGIANCYNNIGNIYLFQENYSESLKNYLVALKLFEEIGDKNGTAGAYVNIGLIHRKHGGKNSEALKYSLAALKIFEEIGAKNKIALCYDNIGQIYEQLADYPEAFKNYLTSLSIAEETGDKRQIASAYMNLGKVNIQLNKLADAKKCLDNALLFSKESGSKDFTRDSYNGLAALDSVMGNYRQALVHYKLYTDYKDSLLNEISSKQIARMKEQYESEKKDEEIVQLESDKQKLETEKQIDNLLLKTKQDSLSIVQAENDKAQLENEKMHTLNLYNEQQIALLGNEKELQQLQIGKDKADYALKKAEADRQQEQLVILNKEKAIRDLQLIRQKQTKNYFIAGLILFVVLSFFVYRNYSTRQKLKLLTLRNKIASDLHDDVGSTLSSISIFSQMAQEQSREVIPMLETIGESSSKMLDAMADIVWTINPENDQFEKIIMRMRSFAYELLGAKKIDFEFITDSQVEKIHVPMEVRKNLYLIFKEATNNMVKYAQANKAMFAIRSEKNNLTMMIQDNGRGFDVRKSTEGNGLKNMKKRAKEIGAAFTIDSQPGSGTTIQLKVAV
jgi:signal transduction histidine kinase